MKNFELALAAAHRMSEPTAIAERAQLADSIDYWVGRWECGRLVWPLRIASAAGLPRKAGRS